MPTDETREVLRNIDQRLQRVEQILPTLATKDELKVLATKEDLKTLATKDEMREEGERSRLYMKILAEEIKDKVDAFAERLGAVDQRDAHQHAQTIKRHVALERRVTALEAKRPRRRS